MLSILSSTFASSPSARLYLSDGLSINAEEIIEADIMGLVRDRWRFSFRRSSFHTFSIHPPSPQTPSTVSKSPDPLPEFLCPISGALMADPVITPSGDTFERACIEACRDLSVYPPSLSLDHSSSLILIPNTALRAAIIRWCDSAGVPHPLKVSSEVASRLASLLLPSSKSQTTSSTELPNENCSPTTSSTSSYQSSSSSSGIIAIPKPQTLEPPLPADPLEDQYMEKLKHAKMHEQESALNLLLEATRESASCRVALGSSRLLAVLKDLLHTCHTAVKSTILAVIVNLSLEPANKVRIVRSGVVPDIVHALHPSSPPEATLNAVGALFSLALEEQNRTVIGVLGAVPPLLRLFCTVMVELRTRLEAGMALHYLGLTDINMTKVARMAGAVKGLMSVANADQIALRRVAMRLMVGLVENREGKTVMLDGGVVEASVALLRNEQLRQEEEEMGVRMLYGMSFVGLRFRGIARRAGAEQVLERVAEGLEGERREMARMTLKAIRGEDKSEIVVARNMWATAAELGEERSGTSEKLAPRRRCNQDSGGGSGPKSAGF